MSVFWNFKRKFGILDKSIIKNYFNNNSVIKLHIGCGKNIHRDWLNSDFFPKSSKILHLDATKKFPFFNDSINYIFCEHMIEHISYSDAQKMLSECYRVLKKGGKIRISTPNLKFLIDLYNENKTQLKQDYIKWSTDNFIEHGCYYDDAIVINNFFRDWGAFVYL